jgi:outer membrane lipoprotein-sorting protein
MLLALAAAVAVAPGTAFPEYAPSTAAITAPLVAERFKEVDARLKSLKATFRQFVRMEGTDAVQSVEGEVSFKKPDLLRLTHKVPEPQTVVSDGTWLWVHRQSTNQVIQTKLDAWRKSEPLAQGLLDFGRTADLLARYDAKIKAVSEPGGDGHRSFEVELRPKPADLKKGQAPFKLTLKSSTRDYFPAEATLEVERAVIRSIFESPRLNPGFADKTFAFAPPPGADVFQYPESR